ncbi:polysaccharide deacetylase family protein [Nitrosopumilus sp.]|uniref:polysaccharide deacetylase family protein n=1 Tax=Nitrosopumilus sp. TaxID=2024843 RepID=UPI00261E063A|nr:polysaccharide deacetylase family protein [Nitrosopumilus sp.]
MTKNSLIITAFSAIFLIAISNSFVFAEEIGQLELEVHSTNGDIVDHSSMKFVIYQDFEQVPFLTTDANANPSIVEVPINHNYKVEVYVNDIYASVDYIEFNEQSEKLNISIPLSAGLKIKVYYDDGLTPIDDATVVIKSNENTELRRTLTNDSGETQRFWIQSTTKLDEYYVADVYISDIFLLSESQIRLQPGQQLDHKITTNIPKIIEKLFTISLYKNAVNKITTSDGNYEITITNVNSDESLTSDVNFRGEAHFSNIKPGLYTATVTSNDPNESKHWNVVNLEILGDITNFNLFRTEIIETEPEIQNPEVDPVETKSEFTDCNCVVFRFDDVQDYWLADTQVQIIELFAEKQVPLTIGVIGSLIGEDQRISSVIEKNVEEANIEIANHSWNNDVVTTLDEITVEKYIQDTNTRIIEEFGVTPTTFIPPQNIYDDSTVEILKNNGFTVLSSHSDEINTLTLDPESFYIIPAITETAKLVNNDTEWQMVENSEIISKIQNSVSKNGYAIVMMHPQEFSLNEQGEYDVPNQESIKNLGILLDDIKKLDVNLASMNQINRETIVEDTIIETCDCVAFRLDDVQDYWLNDVQINIMKKFKESNTPLTIGIIANAFGNDEKITSYVRDNTNNLEIASRGVDLNSISGLTKQKQSEIIAESISKIKNDVGVEPKTFIPPGNKFDEDTVLALKENGITHLSASLTNGDSPPFPLSNSDLFRFPQITSTGTYNIETLLFESQNSDKILDELELSVDNFGFGVITMSLQEFATVEDGMYVNISNQKELDNLNSLILKIKEKGYNIVTIDNINIDSSANVPSWIKNNAGWWADGSIDDATFVQGIEYLVNENIIKVSEKRSSEESASTVPSWIKNNAGWWADGSIDDATFVQGIEYLVKTGIILY